MITVLLYRPAAIAAGGGRGNINKQKRGEKQVKAKEDSMVERLENALLTFIETQTVTKNEPSTEACAMAVPQAARVLIELWDKTDRI